MSGPGWTFKLVDSRAAQYTAIKVPTFTDPRERGPGAVLHARPDQPTLTRYAWGPAHDATVRPEHMALDGRVIAPIASHPNCRCFIGPHPLAARFAAREQARKFAALRADRIARGPRRRRARVVRIDRSTR